MYNPKNPKVHHLRHWTVPNWGSAGPSRLHFLAGSSNRTGRRCPADGRAGSRTRAAAQSRCRGAPCPEDEGEYAVAVKVGAALAEQHRRDVV